ncbi:MAG TPA: carbonic anhydrase family protein [Myxococcota bacterium]|nr:carbonic anhydrase family protein [Myxococcota bacterium]
MSRPLFVAAFAAISLAVASGASAQQFGYFGSNGPAFWGELDPSWEACGTGEIQSPVDFSRAMPPKKRGRPLAIEYGTTTGEIFNNGHTIEIETDGENTLTIDGVEYALVQFHFHLASEHRVRGRGYDMELHLVHKAADGSNAVIGVFLTRGISSGALTPIFANLPDDLNVKHPLTEPFDPSTFLPAEQARFQYVGSLTTPPCTEGVHWIVMSAPVTVSDEDIAQFAERIHFNARFTQRTVK